ncbi:MAG: dockerin type I repeat-containing protein, partial [Oscillospiraceae bacterium]|nr:dockerin type I repeat-containing protein [Oscillospiraceae bacterium]
HLGRSFVTLRGIGNYAGDLDVEFNVAPEKLTEAPDPQERGEIPEISMALNEEYAVPHCHLGEARVFTYTAEKDGTYYLTLPDTLADEISAFVYNGAGNCVPQPANGISLKKGEKCAVYCVANFILEDEIKSDYTIMISDIDTSAEYEVNGIVYRLTKDGAVLVRLNTDAVGIEIPDTITITALDQSFPFAGIDAIGFRSYADNCTIYGTLGGTVHTYCRENGYCFAGLDPSATAAGDVTGDQIVDSDDVLTLTRWIAQSKGMRLNDTAFAQADINQDGIIDLTDVRGILRIMKENPEKEEQSKEDDA